MKMKNIFRAVVLVSILGIAILDIMIFCNGFLYRKAAERTEDLEKKIVLLEKAKHIYPSNDLVYYELGKAYFDKGYESITDAELGKEYFQRSAADFERSIRINPASAFSHFNYAQTLLYLDFFLPEMDKNAFLEFKKAALLAGHNSEVYYEVGKIFLTRWSQLSEEDQTFTTDMLRRILAGKEWDRLPALLPIWEINIADYDVIKAILPDDARLLRRYARYLAEKSLSLEERRSALAKAEYLEFQGVEESYIQALREFQRYELDRAFKRFRSCLESLDGIRFYQRLSKEYLIDVDRYEELKKSCLLHLIKCKIMQGQGLLEIGDELDAFLKLEKSVAAIAELEAFLEDYGHLKGDWSSRLDDWNQLLFQVRLAFAQNEYRNIIGLGRFLNESLISVPEAKKEIYLQVLQIVGDSYQKVGYLYDAEMFLNKALEVDPDNIQTLVRMERIYDRLNEDGKKRTVRSRINQQLSHSSLLSLRRIIRKGASFAGSLTLADSGLRLTVGFEIENEDMNPLISIFLNNMIVWEEYAENSPISIHLQGRTGLNTFRLVSLNSPIELIRILCEPQP
jgi:hypothetical protein